MQDKGLTSFGLGLMASGLCAGLLLLWRMLYPVSEAGLILVAVMALLIWRGTTRRALARRLVWRGAVLNPKSWLYAILSGRILAHLAGILAASLAVIPLAEFALSASLAALEMAGAILLGTGLVLPLAARALRGHVRAVLVPAALIPPLGWTLGVLAAAALFWLGWFVDPVPPEADAPGLAAALEIAQGALPARDGVLAWLMALPRALETLGWMLAAQSADLAFAPVGFMLVLSYHALIGAALVRFVLDCATALLPGRIEDDLTP